MRSQAGLRRPPTAASATTVRVTLAWQLAERVLTLTATTLRRGASYQDSWSISPSIPITSATVVDASVPRRSTYVSRAAVAASSLVPDTTYTFSYAIVMKAGARTWIGSGSTAITVADAGLPIEVAAATRRRRP